MILNIVCVITVRLINTGMAHWHYPIVYATVTKVDVVVVVT